MHLIRTLKTYSTMFVHSDIFDTPVCRFKIIVPVFPSEKNKLPSTVYHNLQAQPYNTKRNKFNSSDQFAMKNRALLKSRIDV